MNKNNFLQSRVFVSTVMLLMLLAASAVTAFADCAGHQPSDLEEELSYAITNLDTPTPAKWTNWQICLDPTFNAWSVGASQNLPVVSAAVGLYRTPNAKMPGSQVTYVNWWITYLASQTGQLVPTNPARLRYFKGTELFSNIYDAPVVTSVVAVRYWAFRNNHAQLKDLSQRYLRANWAIYGFAAGSDLAATYDMPGRVAVYPPQTPAQDTQFNPYAPRRPNGGYGYSGHFLALAGTRSNIGHWAADDKFPLYDRAIEYTPTQTNENYWQKVVLEQLKPKWNAISPQPAENLYALNSTDRTNLNTLRESGTNASTILPWLAGIRLATTYRIIGWPGFRASSMEKNASHNETNMYGISYSAPDRKATFLFPWYDRNGGNADGWCVIEPGIMRASNEPGDPPNHPLQYVSMVLPTTTPLFHLVLSQNAEPYLESTAPPATFPPRNPPQIDVPRNP